MDVVKVTEEDEKRRIVFTPPMRNPSDNYAWTIWGVYVSLFETKIISSALNCTECFQLHHIDEAQERIFEELVRQSETQSNSVINLTQKHIETR